MVSVRALRKQFGDREVLKGIDLEVAEGEILAVMGSSGGGKTTLLRCISGLIEPTSGSVSVDGVDVLVAPEQARERMGLVFQSAALFDFMSVRENVAFGLRRLKKMSVRQLDETVAKTLHGLGLDDATSLMPADLSGGMRKRVGIARALVLEPRVMLYDEPTTGLDPITAYTIDQLIVDVRANLNVTSIVVSHDVHSVSRVADRIAFLHEGELSFLGTPKEFAHSDFPEILELVAKATATTMGPATRADASHV